MPAELQALVGHTVTVKLSRIPFGDYFTLTLDNGHTEELEPEETRKWFYTHGVTDKLGLEKCLDECWNFYESVVEIDSFKVPVAAHPAFEVKL